MKAKAIILLILFILKLCVLIGEIAWGRICGKLGGFPPPGIKSLCVTDSKLSDLNSTV